MAEENRSFDHYFGKLNDYRAQMGLPRSVDGLPDDCSSTNSNWNVPCSAMNLSPDANGVPTTPIYAFHLITQCIDNTSPDWITSHWDFNSKAPSSDTPLMDGFVISAASAARSSQLADTAGIRAMGFYTQVDLPYYYWLATNFATSDRWFSPIPARTEPNRYYLVGATSNGRAYPTQSALQGKTIFDLLNAAGITWKIYSQNGFTEASAFSGFLGRFANHIVPLSQFISDAQSGNLPQVSYIEKPDADEHPNSGESIQSGIAVNRQILNAFMYGPNGGPSPSWSDSVFILTFDEGGSLFDHVPSPTTGIPNPDGVKPIDICTASNDPLCSEAAKTHTAPPFDPDGDFTRYGFRVPLMVISPFTIPHFVSHTVTDSTAWMKFVETRFGLPNLTARDAAAMDMTEFFDFQNPPNPTPPSNPPSDNAGTCHDSLP
jgi:phospholipase C